MDIPIIFEDEGMMVVSKPAGITVNRSDTTRAEITVQDWAEKHIGISEVPADDPTDFYKRGGVVHRLDKETSGILLLAKNPEAFVGLQAQFKERTIHKTYLALTHGRVLPETGEITVPVGRLPWDRKRFGIVAGGREAATKYVTKKKYLFTSGRSTEPLTLLELYPETGRTHQIRVHLKYINRPIFSDFLYAGRKTSRDDRKYVDRVFLHAARISLQHPVSKKEMIFESPMPDDLTGFITNNLIEELRK